MVGILIITISLMASLLSGLPHFTLLLLANSAVFLSSLDTEVFSGHPLRMITEMRGLRNSGRLMMLTQLVIVLGVLVFRSVVCSASTSYLVFRLSSSDANEGSGSLRMALYVFGREKSGRAERAIKTDFTSMRRMI